MKSQKKIFVALLMFLTIQVNAAIVRQDVPYYGNLFMTIFYDDATYSSADNCTKKPFREVVMMMHGGYFLFGNRSDMNNTCIEFAKLGYAAVTIDYRKGGYILSDCTPTNSYNIVKASYRAAQDAISALSFIQNNLARFVPNVNTGHIFAGGFSAGAFTALNIGFIQQDEINADYPLIEADLGPLSRNNTRVYPSIVLNNAGAVTNLNYINTIARGMGVPFPFVINMAAIDDPVVPYFQGNFGGCSVNPFLYGTDRIYRRLDALNICHLTVTDSVGGHGAFRDDYVVSTADGFIKSLYPILWERSHCPAILARKSGEAMETRQTITIYKSAICSELANPARNSSFSKKSEDPFSIGTQHISDNNIQVNIQSKENDSYKTEVYSLNGQLVSGKDWIVGTGGALVQTFNIPNLNHGFYLIKVTSLQTNSIQFNKIFINQ